MRKIEERHFMSKELKKVMFSDVVGYEKEKVELEEIKNFILNVSKYEEMGARIPKGILLVGESGNGKTLMAKALANETSIPFYSLDDVSGDKKVLSIRELFAKARNNSPCIIFIDEIDKIDNNGGFDGMMPNKESPLIRELLIQMDGFEPNSGIMVIATANGTEFLSKSLLRSGRFDRTIEIRMPNTLERKKLFEYYSSNKKIDKSIDFEKIAIRTSGLSCADVDNILNDAALIATRNNKKKIEMADLEQAIDRVMLGSATTKQVSDEIRRMVATHEVGHAVVMIKTGGLKDIDKISIISRGKAMGFVRRMCAYDEMEYEFTTKSKLVNSIISLYGGLAAEKVMLKETTSGCVQDLDDARGRIVVMIGKFGMCGIKNAVDGSYSTIHPVYSNDHKKLFERKVDRLSRKYFNKALRIIKANKKLFNELYNRVLEENVLYKEEIEAIIQN